MNWQWEIIISYSPKPDCLSTERTSMQSDGMRYLVPKEQWKSEQRFKYALYNCSSSVWTKETPSIPSRNHMWMHPETGCESDYSNDRFGKQDLTPINRLRLLRQHSCFCMMQLQVKQDIGHDSWLAILGLMPLLIQFGHRSFDLEVMRWWNVDFCFMLHARCESNSS